MSLTCPYRVAMCTSENFAEKIGHVLRCVQRVEWSGVCVQHRYVRPVGVHASQELGLKKD